MQELKKYRKVICFCIVLLLGILIGGESIIAYLDNHTYYFGDDRRNGAFIFNDDTNIWLVVISLILSCIPLLYIYFSNKFSIKKMIAIFGVVAGIFGTIHCCIKGELIGLGALIAFFNTILLFAIGSYSMLGFASIGSLIERKFIQFQQRRWQEIALSFGIGLALFLLLINVLLQLDLLYGWVSIMLFVGFGVAIYFARGILQEDEKLLSQEILNIKGLPQMLKICLYGLMIIAFAYFLFGFQNSFIPYSTAWDANHEYMYIPKILSENGGVMRGNTVANSQPGLWHGFIAFFFSIAGGKGLPWHQILGLNPNTIAVSANFRSAILVFIFGIGMVSEVIGFLKEKFLGANDEKKEEKSEIKQRICPVCKKVNKGSFCGKCGENAPIQIKKTSGSAGIIAGWLTIILWLTSGTGAFLVMVDNKTDLGLMALSSLALFSGILFLEYLQNEQAERKEYLKYLVISGVLFGCACLAKVNAFIDLSLFGILFIGLRLSNITALGVGFLVAGITRILGILTAPLILSDLTGKAFVVIGIILIIGGILNALRNGRKIGTVVFQGVVLLFSAVMPFLLFKTPGLIYSLKLENNLSVESFKGKILRSKADFDTTKALASAEENLGKNPLVKAPQDAKTCLAQGNIYSEEELKSTLVPVEGSWVSEDFMRYIGYGRKEFYYTRTENVEVINKKTGNKSREEKVVSRNVVYPFIKLFFLKEGCYGTDETANKLCEISEKVDNFEIKALKQVYQELQKPESEGGQLLKTAIDTFDAKYASDSVYYDPLEFRDQIVDLRQFYQSHSIKSAENYLAIPYRFLIPLNISMNRSLQNESSYYTDLGYIWIIVYLVMIGALVYALIVKEKKLFSVALTNLIGRGIRWIIGSAIIRYGTVLISWSAITMTMLFSSLCTRKHSVMMKNLIHLMGVLCGLAVVLQLILNFSRIASQGAAGPFVWYKENVGREYYYDENLQGKERKKYGYGEKDIFDLQFPQYNSIISYLKDRNNEDGVTIAGTYIQYFLDNQQNLKMDALLLDFAEQTSDGDLCKSYRRLRNDKMKYFIVDPNIGSVGMGEGNESLFNRFFAKINAVTKKIEKDGTLSTLARMYKEGYLKLISTNHIGIFYALTLSDDELRAYLGDNDHEISDEDLILMRAKFMGMRYFSDELEGLFNQVYSIFYNRIGARQAVPELLQMLGVDGDANKVLQRINEYIDKHTMNTAGLSKGEISAMIQYINMYEGIQVNNKNAGDMMYNLIINSISSSSQIMGLELI